MNRRALATVSIFVAGVILGTANSHLSSASAATEQQSPDLSKRKFRVFITEVKENFVFGDAFSGTYAKTITMSDGSRREVQLTPKLHNGMQVVEFKDTGGLTYMSLNGTTTNGRLMVQVMDEMSNYKQLKEQGWKIP